MLSLNPGFTDNGRRRGFSPLALSPLSLIYLAVVKNRARRFHPEKLPVPVIVVGNIYVGGTGKTPVTIELVKALAALGYHPGVISRGYGRKDSAPVMVVPESPAAVVGDEPLSHRAGDGRTSRSRRAQPDGRRTHAPFSTP